MKLTIEKNHRNEIVARDEEGNVKARASTYCNPSALAQVICEAETIGEIDWENSKVAKPELAPIDKDWMKKASTRETNYSSVEAGIIHPDRLT